MAYVADKTNITIYGRLSFPVFSYAEAVARNAKSPTPNPDPTKVTPEFNLLLEQPQFEKFRDFCLKEFLPFCEEQFKAGEKRNALSPQDVARLVKLIESGDWDAQPPYIPIKSVSEKSLALMPDAVVSVKVKGQRGVDIEQRALVYEEDELVVPDPSKPFVKGVFPINKTVHTLYPGCYAGATLNLYSFLSGKLPGFSASAGVCVFKTDADRFGGGTAVDEDALFED